ncbi:MAG: hypothetical protein ACOC1D_05750 [Prolixibacteraceae bacterium]
MTTLKITVDNKKNARLLVRLLRNMKFVKKVEEETLQVHKNQYAALKELFSSIKANHLFQKIEDPVKWQKGLRDKWETS